MSSPSTFDAWMETLIESTAEEDAEGTEIKPEWLSWLREVYERHGPASRTELNALSRAACVASAEDVLPTLAEEIERTTGHAAELRVWEPEPSHPDDDGLGLRLIITGGGTSRYPVGWGPDRESALVGIADFTMEWVTEAVRWPWPTCPVDNYGLDPELVGGRAVWRCRSPFHEIVARIGDLGR